MGGKGARGKERGPASYFVQGPRVTGSEATEWTSCSILSLINKLGSTDSRSA